MNKKVILGVVGALCAGMAIMLGSVIIGYPAISQLVGLAVAQSPTQWTNVVDAAKGDAQQSGILGTSLYMFNGVAFDRARGDTTNGIDVDVTRLGGTLTPSDAFANPTDISKMWTLNSIFNGSTWDRMRTASGDALSTGLLAVGNLTFNGSTWDRMRTASGDALSTGLLAAGNLTFNGSTWDRVRSASADALAATGISARNNVLFNGSTFDRQRGVSATNNTATTTTGVAYSTQLSTWVVTNTQSGAVQATVSKAAGGTTVRHVATDVTICRGDTAVAAPVLVHLRNGASGVGTILRSWVIGISTANESKCENVTGLNITGSANTAMTLEFAAAGSATSISTVTLAGYSTP
jgi:hypothetical protein